MAVRTKVFVDIVTKSDGKEPGAGLKKFAIGAGIAAVAIAGLIKLGKELEDVYAVQEQAEARLTQTIIATGKAAGFTNKELFDMASGLQEVTKFGDEAIIGAQSLLLTFKDIGGDVFPRALESILDVSEAMGTDLQSSTIQLGKALNDPIGGIAALTRVGIQFTDKQKDTIKSMVEMGDKAAAQGIILEELESQFGGVAEAAAATSTGVGIQLKNSFGDLLETLGQVTSEGLVPYRLELMEEIVAVNNSIKAHFLRGKALRGEATIIELLVLRELEQTKAEDRLSQAKENLARSEQTLIDLGEKSDSVSNLRRDSIKTGIENAKANVTVLENEVNAKTRATEATQRLFSEEQNLLDVKLAEFEATENLNEATEEEISSKEDLLEAERNLFKGKTEIADEWREAELARIFEIAEAEQEAADESIRIAQEAFDAKLQIASEFSAALSSFSDLAVLGNNNEIASIDASIAAAKEKGEDTKELEKEKRKLLKENWKAEKAFSTTQAVINTALAVTKALSAAPPPFNAILAALSGAAGAAQIAVIQGQAMPAFATGGQFITDGPTTIGNNLVGDNASGQERVTVTPLGGGDNGGGRQVVYFQFAPGVSLKGYMQELINTRQLHSSRGGAI